MINFVQTPINASPKNANETLYRTDSCMRTISGIYVDVMDPDPATLSIFDIAHALSNQIRFGGHMPVRYTVAQHSVLCAQNLPHDATDRERFAALMHDTPEAYLVDVIRPVKKLLPEYYTIEHNLSEVLSKKFNFEYPYPDSVKHVDEQALIFEWNNIVLKERDDIGIEIWDFDTARIMFLKEFMKYKHIHGIDVSSLQLSNLLKDISNKTSFRLI